jgi:hypothetical protein
MQKMSQVRTQKPFRLRPELKTVALRCGHDTEAAEPATVSPTRGPLYRCPQGCGFQQRSTRSVAA